jgi:transcriptional regulator with XRE-family HTH domain
MTRYTVSMTSGRTARPDTRRLAEALTGILDATMHARRASAVAVAAATGVNRQTVGLIRNGGRAPDLHTAVALADWCGYDVMFVPRES